MGAITGFIIGVWNFAVSIAPAVIDVICQTVHNGAKTITF